MLSFSISVQNTKGRAMSYKKIYMLMMKSPNLLIIFFIVLKGSCSVFRRIGRSKYFKTLYFNDVIL